MLKLENLDGVGRDARGSQGRGRGHPGRSAPRTSGQFANLNLRYRAPKAGECRALYFATGCLSRKTYRELPGTGVPGQSASSRKFEGDRGPPKPRSASATHNKDMCTG